MDRDLIVMNIWCTLLQMVPLSIPLGHHFILTINTFFTAKGFNTSINSIGLSDAR